MLLHTEQHDMKVFVFKEQKSKPATAPMEARASKQMQMVRDDAFIPVRLHKKPFERIAFIDTTTIALRQPAPSCSTVWFVFVSFIFWNFSQLSRNRKCQHILNWSFTQLTIISPSGHTERWWDRRRSIILVLALNNFSQREISSKIDKNRPKWRSILGE